MPSQLVQRTAQAAPDALDSGSLHSPEFVLKVLDLVPDPGGDLELQLGGGRVHLLGQLTDQRDQVTTGLAPARRGPAGGLVGGLPSSDLADLIQQLTDQMHNAAAELQFEVAARYRDEISELKKELRQMTNAGAR